jgi:hypothetical protein
VTPPQRIPDHTREEIADYIRAHAGTPEGTVRAIANRWGIAKSSVGRIADLHDLTDAWADGVAQTQAATAARSAYIARQRATLQEDLLDTAADLLDRLHDNVVHLNVVKCLASSDQDDERPPSPFTPTIEIVEQTVLPAGPAEWRQTMNAVQAAVAQAVSLAKLDNDTSTTASVTGLLDQFAADLARDLGDEEEEPPPSGEPA